MMNKKMPLTFFLMAILGMSSLALAQRAISVNIHDPGQTTYELDPNDDVTGVVPMKNWVNTDVVGSADTVSITDNNGDSAGTLFFTGSLGNFSNANSQNVTTPTNIQKLFSRRTRDPGATANFSGIPFDNYDVYVYMGFGTFQGSVRININGGPNTFCWWNQLNVAGLNNFTRCIPGTDSSPGVKGNYVLFPELSGSSLTVATLPGSKGWCCGYQIVEVPIIGITAPQNNAIFDVDDDITLTARVLRDPNVVQVEFFEEVTPDNLVSIGVDSTGDGNGYYSFVWPSRPIGDYTVKAEVTYDDAGPTLSEPVTFTVKVINEPPFNVNAGDDQFTFLADGSASADLSGSYEDDGISAVTVTWSEDPANPAGADLVGDLNSENISVDFSGAIPNATDFSFIFSVDDGKNPSVTDSVTVKVYADGCEAAKGEGIGTRDPADFNDDCVVNLDDLITLSVSWLNYTGL